MSAEKALKRFADTIKTENGRQRVKDDPDSALADLPAEVKATLAKLSKQELKTLSELNETFVRAGLKSQVPDGGSIMIL